MKKIVLFVMILSLFLYGEGLSVRPTQDVSFSNGFGTIFAKPMLNDKNLQEKITLQGQFNVDEINNVEITFDKVQYQGKLYSLDSVFVKKSRLRDRSAILKKEDNFVVVGGNQDELLNILNLEVETTKEKNDDNLADINYGASGSNAYDSSSRGNFGNGILPTTIKSETIGDDHPSKWERSNDATMIVDCPTPTYSNGIATYYVQQGTVCIKQTSNSAYEKYNTRSCQNKVDYENNQISLGFEMFVTTPEGQDILVKSCEYEEPIKLQSEVGSCKAIADFENNKALISKQFYYIHENSRKNVGQCTPTSISVPLEHDLNVCKDDRHDFTKGFSYPQTQYFYRYENVKRNIGECVDAHEYEYKHYMDDTTCDWEVIDGRVFYRQRVAYDDLLGQKKFATDCETTSSGGIEVHEEFAGYNFYDQSKQAIRKINKFFYVPDTTNKIYVDENIETTKAYPYIEEECKIENDDEALKTIFYKQITFNDTDEDKIVEVSPCQVDQIIPYQKLSVTEVLVDTLTDQLIEPTGTAYKILDTNKVLTGQPNWTRNTPSFKTPNLTHSGKGYNPSSGTLSVITNEICTEWSGGNVNSKLERKIGDVFVQLWREVFSIKIYVRKCNFPISSTKIVKVTTNFKWLSDSPTFNYYFQYELKNGAADNQIIDVIESQQDYLRGDGTTYTQPNSGTLKYIAK